MSSRKRKIADPSPTAPGYYWLALDNASDWIEGSPFLVKIGASMEPVGHEGASFFSIRVKFLDGRFYELHAEIWSDIAHGAIRRVYWATHFGGFAVGSSGDEYRLTWLGSVSAPGLPELPPFEVDAHG